jgi:Leucine-rich repeat (LRR) protein
MGYKIDKEGKLDLAYNELSEIPYKEIGNEIKKIKYLDLSHNKLKELGTIEYFTEIESLILDHNRFTSLIEIGMLPKLSLVKNKIKSLKSYGLIVTI